MRHEAPSGPVAPEAAALDERIRYLRRPRILLVLAALMPMLAAAAVLTWTAGGITAWNRAALMAVPPSLLLLLAWARGWRARRTPTRVRLVGDVLEVAGVGRIRRSDIKFAYLVPRPRRPDVLRIERNWHLVTELLPRGRAQAERLLAALGHDAERVAIVFQVTARLQSPFARLSTLAGVICALLVAASVLSNALGITDGSLRLWVYLFAGAGATGAFVEHGRVRIGSDGIAVQGHGRDEFVPWSDYAGHERRIFGGAGGAMDGLLIHRHSGVDLELPVQRAKSKDVLCAAIDARIRAAYAVHARSTSADAGEVLRRGRRETRDWLRVLRGVGAGANAGPRAAAVPVDVLHRVLGDPARPADERAAAAVALVTRGDDDAARRVRVAGQASAEPRLRVALERVADAGDDGDGGDDELVAALEAVTERGAPVPSRARRRRGRLS